MLSEMIAETMAAMANTLFVGNLPFATCASDVRRVLEAAVARSTLTAAATTSATTSAGGGGVVERVSWLADHTTGLFYGSAFVRVTTLEAAR